MTLDCLMIQFSVDVYMRTELITTYWFIDGHLHNLVCDKAVTIRRLLPHDGD